MNLNGDTIDEQLLRKLDSVKVLSECHMYQLVVATDPFAMRGFDYRVDSSFSQGIALVIAKSFAYEREAIQGLNRVGRYGDQCKRIIIDSVPLIDKDAVF